MTKNISTCSCGRSSKDLAQTKGNCPACNNKGEEVGKVTVEHLCDFAN